MTPSRFRLLKVNGLHHPPPESLYNALVPAPLPPSATFVQISVTMGFSAPCTAAPPVRKRLPVTLPIIVWRPNAISVIGGDILTRCAIFGSAEDAITQAMWSITALSTRLMSPTLDQLMGEPTRTTKTSTPLWMTTREMVCVEPGARIYEGGNVTISFLSHVFFLISVV